MRHELKVLLVVALLAGCSDSAVNPDPEVPEPFLIVGGDMGRFNQNVSVSRGSLSVEEAEVVVNGVALTRISPGFFQGPLLSVVPAGSTITIVVSDNDVTATGTVTAMENPTLVTPAHGTVHPIGEPLLVTWASDEDPDEFVVALSWTEGTSGTSARTEVAGNIRQVTIPTTPVPAGATDVRVTILAYRDGIFTGAVDPDSRMRVRVESDEHDLTLGSDPFLIVGSDMGRLYQTVNISRGGLSTAGATATVNGVTLSQSFPGSFHVVLPSAVPVGSPITIVVSEDDVTATGTTTAMPDPVLVAPADGTVHPIGAPLTVSWTSDEDPDEFVVSLSWIIGASGMAADVVVDGNIRQATIPTTPVPPGATDVAISIRAYRDGVFTGAAHPDSRMRVRTESNWYGLTIAP